MSTRSGRQIHKSIEDELHVEEKPKENKRTQSTRSRRHENNENKTKKRQNYVAYPTDDETGEPSKPETALDKPSRKRKKEILVEVNTNEVEQNVDKVDSKPVSRATRRTRRFADETVLENQPQEEIAVKKNKKNKKKNSETMQIDSETKVPPKKSAKKKGKSKKTKSNNEKEINKSAATNDSFHSATSRICSPEPDVKLSITKQEIPRIIISPCSEIDKHIEMLNKSAQENVTDKPTDKLNGTFEIVQTDDNSKAEATLTPEVPSNRRLTRQSSVLNSTYDKDPKRNSTFNRTKSIEKVNTTFDTKDNDPESDKNNKSYVTGNNVTQISVNNSKSFNIFNTTPILVDSSLEESVNTSTTHKSSMLQPDPTPLTREGTFTKDGPEPIIILSKIERTPSSENLKTPTKRPKTMQSPGCTPYPSNKKEKVLNVTTSIERKSLSSNDAPKNTKVAFCSPANNDNLVNERKSKVIKSSIKGSNKSFLFDTNESVLKAGTRKRSYTASDVEDRSVKRKKTWDERQETIDRLSRPRSLSAQPKTDQTPNKLTPVPPKSQPRSRSKLPNFAALHERNFSKMESLDECVERKKKRAKRLLLPNGNISVVDRSSLKPLPSDPKSTTKSTPVNTEPLKINSKPKESVKITDKSINLANTEATKNTQPKKLEVATEKKPGYTRFGFKLNLEVNPFSITTVTTKESNFKPNGLKRELTAPSMSTTTKPRKEIVKNIVAREKSSGNLRCKLNEERVEARTIIKGVRSNRRFELQMKMRKMN